MGVEIETLDNPGGRWTCASPTLRSRAPPPSGIKRSVAPAPGCTGAQPATCSRLVVSARPTRRIGRIPRFASR
ncbi:MAG: hypothetical protein M3P83_04245 [Actinomycetota bacterium]|nr:hypothetical protein [Actinomycetota bacterium]